jgi:hypothetical protein
MIFESMIFLKSSVLHVATLCSLLQEYNEKKKKLSLEAVRKLAVGVAVGVVEVPFGVF